MISHAPSMTRPVETTAQALLREVGRRLVEQVNAILTQYLRSIGVA